MTVHPDSPNISPDLRASILQGLLRYVLVRHLKVNELHVSLEDYRALDQEYRLLTIQVTESGAKLTVGEPGSGKPPQEELDAAEAELAAVKRLLKEVQS